MNIHKSRVINVGNVLLGGDNPVRVQSMTNTDTRDAAATISQIKHLETLGCEIIRVSVPDQDSVNTLPEIIKSINIPLIADIHFDYRLATASLKAGADCVRINPGNIGGREKTLEVVKAAADLGKAIRIGVNSGSLEKDILQEGGVSSEALVKSALRSVETIESTGFKNYKVSLKASNVRRTVEACEQFRAASDVPLHIGITEAGTLKSGTVKSAVGIGALLLRGIGETIRVSLTADPAEEISVAWMILSASGIRRRGVEVISCPTCARTSINIIELAEKVEKHCADINAKITVAVMGCAVNGPGEAKEADYGIAGGKGEGLIFRKGEIVKKVPEASLIEELMTIIKEENL